MKKIGLFGCGAIGAIVAEYVDKDDNLDIIALYDKMPQASFSLADKIYNSEPEVVENISQLLSLEPDIVVEAASPEAAAKYDPMILRFADVVSMDTGIMTTKYDELKDISEKSGHNIYFPSGAVGGIDAILAMAEEGIEKLEIITTKKPGNIKGYEDLEERTEVFYGTASEAIKKFPRNINVAVTLSFAAQKEADVRIVADPDVKYNQHEIYAKSRHTEFYSRISNIPSDDNPKTSYLAALSAVQILKQITKEDGIKIGN